MALCSCLYLIFQPSRAPEFKGSMKDVLWISDSQVTLSNLISPPNPTFNKLFTFYWGEGHTVRGKVCRVWFFFSTYVFQRPNPGPSTRRANKSLDQPSCPAIPFTSRDSMLSVNPLHNSFISQPYLWCHVLDKEIKSQSNHKRSKI